MTIDGQQIRINTWLADRPDMILGTLSAGRGMYASDTQEQSFFASTRPSPQPHALDLGARLTLPVGGATAASRL